MAKLTSWQHAVAVPPGGGANDVSYSEWRDGVMEPGIDIPGGNDHQVDAVREEPQGADLEGGHRAEAPNLSKQLRTAGVLGVVR